MENLVSECLFKTKALEICPENQPFFYTSGKIGPYYINTHYLFGSKEEASDFLKEMNTWKNDLNTFPSAMVGRLYSQYKNNEIFKIVTDLVTQKAENIEADYISGGERRDFFFSLLTSLLLGKPHISIMKDKTALISDMDFTKSRVAGEKEISGKKVLHIADLVTEASSYLRAWIPAIKYTGGEISETLAVVDRNQSGKQVLLKNKINLFSFVKIDKGLFEQAKAENHINNKQYEMILEFIENPDKFMVDFFKNNPGFLEEKIKAGGKDKERALLCMEKNYHKG